MLEGHQQQADWEVLMGSSLKHGPRVISKDILRFESEMYFIPRNSCREPEQIPLQCCASRKSVWLTAVSTDEDLKVGANLFMTDLKAMPGELGLLNLHHKQSQMASQEFDNRRLGSSSGGTSSGSHMKGEEIDGSVYQLLDASHDVQRGLLQALGAIQILSGILILALGVFLGCLQYSSHHFRHFFFFTFYTGYPLWGAVFFISSGSLTVAAGRKPTRMMMQNSFGMNIASATIAFVGAAFLSVHLVINTQAFKSCLSSQLPDLCISLGSSSNGLVSLMLILSLLELVVTISVSAMWCLGKVYGSREAISSRPNSVESGMPPDENDLNTQPQITTE
ncbi:membrane-spanning 4-domains subfamily A member 3 [Sigmodon hispidus]